MPLTMMWFAQDEIVLSDFILKICIKQMCWGSALHVHKEGNGMGRVSSPKEANELEVFFLILMSLRFTGCW